MKKWKKWIGICLSVAMLLLAVPVYARSSESNLAYGKATMASSIEADSVAAANATDGDTTSRSSRWGSNIGSGPHWIYVDLGEEKDIKTVRIYWETRKAKSYKIEVSNTAAENSWVAVKTVSNRPAQLKDTIVLDEIQHARYVRLYVDSISAEDPDGGVTWNSISIYEMEVYSEELVESVPEKITVDTPAKGDTKLTVHIPAREGYTITYNGTDYEQVVDRDLTIYQPIVDTTVTVSFKIVNDNDPSDYSFEEITVTVPGKYSKDAGDNSAPTVLPELREWKGKTGYFSIPDSGRIVITDASLKSMADVFAADYKDITGKELSIVSSGAAKAGDIIFSLTSDKSKGLQQEGYLMEIDDQISVESETATGAFWATRTILQAIKSGNGSIPKGITRDYPLYEVRGFILDVGRKTFTLDQLEQIVKQMAWYKMNDFQIHLNDNLIPLENYSKNGDDPMTAYSGFRLESNIKKGGNGGLNQADLTSTDVFYTKDEFRNLIKESRVYGVNIVPEIDTPAHSLALTKVRPDLRNGTYGRDNDHLNLLSKYDESLAFVQSIFDEYMGSDLSKPVFDEQTTVHVGADEYSADGSAYRRFCNDMLTYVQASGRTARIWGSLTSIKGDVDVISENVQMNLWNFGWANMDQMYEEGFDLINCNDGNYYIVPNAGYYYDYLNAGTMYNLAINSIGGVTIPAGDEQMIGGAFAIWNDMTDYLNNGISEYDVYDRFNDSLGLFAAKLWGKGSMSLSNAQTVCSTMGDAPNTNFGYEVDADENGIIAQYTADDFKDAAQVNGAVKKVDYRDALELKGGKSYISTNLETVGLGNSLRVKVKRTSDSKEDQVLFESPYGSIKAVQGGTGKVGITRENYDYSFNYELPLNDWVELEFKNEFKKISLYVNGKLTDTLGDGEQIEGRPMVATCMLPVAKVGSETNAFVGYVRDVRIGENANYTSTMELDAAVWLAETLLESMEQKELNALVEEAKAVLQEFDPSDETVTKLTEDIYEIIDTIEYKSADYSRVEAYLAQIPDNILEYFTEESVQALMLVKDSVAYGLPVKMQSRVDGYEWGLSNAIGQLKLKTAENVNYIDNSRLTATASSYQDNSAAPSKALDNDPSTMWHQVWADTTSRHWIDIKIDSKEAVNGITYVPRSGGGNGNLQEYTISVSSDNGKNYTDIKSGELESNAATKVIEFDRVEITNVRIYFDKAVGGNASAAEIKIHAADVEADIAGLKELIVCAENMTNSHYTEDSWNGLQSVIAEAAELSSASNADPEAVEDMKRQIAVKMTELVPIEKQYSNPFIDLVESKYYYEPVLWAVENGITQGRTEITFCPDEACTRAQVVMFLWREAGTPEPKTTKNPFSDIKSDSRFYKAIMWAVENGITYGYRNGTFQPDRNVTRAEFVTFQYRANGKPDLVNTENPFVDVTGAHKNFKLAILWAYQNEITKGKDDTHFRPDITCSRGDVVTFLYRAENIQ